MEAPPTPFIGRHDELAAVAGLLADPAVGLLTLTGPPGVGKTRLAVEAAHRFAAATGVTVAVASLADVGDPGAVPAAVAAALGVADIGPRPPLEVALAAIGDADVLLVLDNVEHVIDAASAVASAVIQSPHVKVLATGRQALALRAEHCVPVSPMAVPPAGGAEESGDAMLLLAAGVRRVRGAVELDAPALAAMADICRAVDGLPLALELAAARSGQLPLATLRDALARRLPVLTGGPRDLPARHRTMRAAIAWSVDLLSAPAAGVLARLSVCVGGADLATIGAVADDLGLDEPSLLEVVGELVTHNLLEVDEAVDPPRFELLEVVREHAADELRRRGEEPAAERRHVAHLLAFAEAAAPQLRGREQVGWLDRLHRDGPAFAAAVRCAAKAGDAASALRLCLALRVVWYVRGSLTEGRALFATALAVPGAPPELQARAAVEASALARHQAAFADALALVGPAMGVARAAGDHDLLAAALLQDGFIRHLAGDYPGARTSLEECFALRQQQGDEMGVALAAHHLGLVAYFADRDVALAWEMQARCLALQRRIGNARQTATVLIAMGEIARARGSLAQSRELLGEAFELLLRLDDLPLLTYALRCTASLVFDEGHANRALRLVGAAEGLERRSGASPWPAVLALGEEWLPRVLGSLGRNRAEALRAAGRALPAGAAVALALATGSSDSPLTVRERQVAELVAEGLTNRAIAERLFLSERTVDGHVARVREKLGFSNRSQIATWVSTLW